SEDDLRREYPEWDTLTNVEQRLFRDNFLNKRKFDLVHQAVQEAKKVDEWAEKVDKFVEKKTLLEEYPQLAGREEEFKSFAMKPTRRGVDLEDLVGAFLFTA